MCGICGYIPRRPTSDPTTITKMNEAIRHRGPDDEGYAVLEHSTRTAHDFYGSSSTINGRHVNSASVKSSCFLGHRRLSILDLSTAGHQPMFDHKRRYAIIYNGEIYNFRQLRNELVSAGFLFHSDCDTEVVLNAYIHWGIDCVSRFDGMWAFAILDIHENRLVCSRDRFGVKPFYYSFQDGELLFASEIKAITSVKKQRLNDRKIYDFIEGSGYFNDRGNESFYEDIFELLPGHNLVYSLDSRSPVIRRYYTLETVESAEPFNEKKNQEYIHRTEELLLKSVKDHLIADVEVASCLSGGIDSSAVSSLIPVVSDQQAKFKVFTAIYEGDAVDESGWARKVVEKYELDWITVSPKVDDLLADIDDLVETHDEPFPTTSIYSQYRVMQTISRNGVKVTLDGQGADELFGGYEGYYRYYMNDTVNSPFHLFPWLAYSRNSPRSLVRNIKNGLTALVFRRRRIENTQVLSVIGERLVGYQQDRLVQSLNNRLLYDFAFGNLRSLLKYEDRNSMRFSVEARTPFADSIELVEYVFSVPSVYKIRKGWNKNILRHSMKEYIPDEIFKRSDKIGFATPQNTWSKMIEPEILTDCPIDGYIKRSQLKKLREEHPELYTKAVILGSWLRKIQSRLA